MRTWDYGYGWRRWPRENTEVYDFLRNASAKYGVGSEQETFVEYSAGQFAKRYERISRARGKTLAEIEQWRGLIAALLWANSPWWRTYERLWATTLTVGVGRWAISQDLRFWVGEGLMTFFFLLAGLEIKRELVVGELLRRELAGPRQELGGHGDVFLHHHSVRFKQSSLVFLHKLCPFIFRKPQSQSSVRAVQERKHVAVD